MVLAVSSQHPFAARKRVRMVELDRQPLVLLPHAFATRVMLDECFRAAGAEPIVCAEMNTIAANVVRAPMGLCVIPLASPTPMRIPGILWKRDARLTAQMRSFSSIVRTLAARRSAAKGRAPSR